MYLRGITLVIALTLAVSAYGQKAPPPAPMISTLSPASGSTAGGYFLVINGKNFGTSATITVGSNACRPYGVTTSVIYCLVPKTSAAGLCRWSSRMPAAAATASLSRTWRPKRQNDNRSRDEDVRGPGESPALFVFVHASLSRTTQTLRLPEHRRELGMTDG
ncbi:MAG TPA: IPT/TIG domain-containing protein [Thermoanaerobaculia bacterium]